MLICSSPQVWEGFFSQFFPILPQLAPSNLGNCSICRLSHCWICFGLYNIYFSWKNHILASQFSGAEEGFSFKVATSKLPKIGKMHIHNCFSCTSIFLYFSQWSCSPNSCRFGPFLMHFHYRLGKRKLFWSPAKTDVLFRLWAGQSLRFQGEDFPRANFIFLMQLSAPYTPTL